MKKLIDFILQYIQLNASQIDVLNKHAKRLHLKKGDFFSNAGKTAQQVGFISEGVLKVCHYDNEGKDITLAF